VKRGCISLGNIKCDECQRTILYPERYLSIEINKSKARRSAWTVVNRKDWSSRNLIRKAQK
jgi:hypothetical protein